MIDAATVARLAPDMPAGAGARYAVALGEARRQAAEVDRLTAALAATRAVAVLERDALLAELAAARAEAERLAAELAATRHAARAPRRRAKR